MGPGAKQYTWAVAQSRWLAWTSSFCVGADKRRTRCPVGSGPTQTLWSNRAKRVCELASLHSSRELSRLLTKRCEKVLRLLKFWAWPPPWYAWLPWLVRKPSGSLHLI